jgi:hypothetical protein
MGVEGVAKINALTHGLILMAEILATRNFFKIALFSHFKTTALFLILSSAFAYWFFGENLRPTIISLSFTYTLAIFSAVGIFIAVITRILDIKKFIAVMKSRD